MMQRHPKVDQHRLDESLGEPRALLIGSDRGHHQVTMVRYGSDVSADEADVCRHSDEFSMREMSACATSAR